MVDGGEPARRDRRGPGRVAVPGDVVAVLGKGHERGQEIAGEVLPFADEDAVREVWAELHPADCTPSCQIDGREDSRTI